jgi:hypothetical protein
MAGVGTKMGIQFNNEMVYRLDLYGGNKLCCESQGGFVQTRTEPVLQKN